MHLYYYASHCTLFYAYLVSKLLLILRKMQKHTEKKSEILGSSFIAVIYLCSRELAGFPPASDVLHVRDGGITRPEAWAGPQP